MIIPTSPAVSTTFRESLTSTCSTSAFAATPGLPSPVNTNPFTDVLLRTRRRHRFQTRHLPPGGYRPHRRLVQALLQPLTIHGNIPESIAQEMPDIARQLPPTHHHPSIRIPLLTYSILFILNPLYSFIGNRQI